MDHHGEIVEVGGTSRIYSRNDTCDFAALEILVDGNLLADVVLRPHHNHVIELPQPANRIAAHSLFENDTHVRTWERARQQDEHVAAYRSHLRDEGDDGYDG